MIVSPSISYVILLQHQLLTASAQLRHRSRMQCNAGVRKTAQLHFRIHLAVDQTLSVCDARGPWLMRARVFRSIPRTPRAIERFAYRARQPSGSYLANTVEYA